jgi:hypothetical protein
MTTAQLTNLMSTLLDNARQNKDITSNTELANALITNRYVVSVEQFDNEDFYSFSNFEQADEFAQSFDKEDGDISVCTYDLQNIGFNSSNELYFESIY